MASTVTSSAGVTLTLSGEERGALSGVLEQVLRDKEVEVHRTDSVEFREHVERQEALLRGLLDRLRQP